MWVSLCHYNIIGPKKLSTYLWWPQDSNVSCFSINSITFLSWAILCLSSPEDCEQLVLDKFPSDLDLVTYQKLYFWFYFWWIHHWKVWYYYIIKVIYIEVIIGRDMNGHVGQVANGFHETHGNFGYGARNAEGERILEFAEAMGYVVTSTLFKKRQSHLVTYESGGNKTAVDMILIKREREIWFYVTHSLFSWG